MDKRGVQLSLRDTTEGIPALGGALHWRPQLPSHSKADGAVTEAPRVGSVAGVGKEARWEGAGRPLGEAILAMGLGFHFKRDEKCTVFMPLKNK